MNSVSDVDDGPRLHAGARLMKVLNLLSPDEALSAGFWVFFTAAFVFDFGVGLYFFLFNLFLANLHFNERVIGIVAGALTLGNVAGTIPVSLVVKRFGLQKALLFCFISAPLISVLRTIFISMPAQVGLAFLTGVALSCWPVCFSPTAAKLTTENNRVTAFSILFATGIGSGTLAGLVGGYLPALIRTQGGPNQLADSMRPILLLACGVVVLGIWPILNLRLGPVEHTGKRASQLIHPFLIKFLPAFALWSLVTGSFTPFAAVFLQKHLAMPLRSIGLIFSASQLVQFAGVLCAPLLYRRFGTVAGIICTQVATGAAAFALGQSHNVSLAVVCYLGFTGAQFMSGPGFYSMLMTRLPEDERSKASAVQNIVGALSQASAAAITGVFIVRCGYPAVLTGNAIAACAAACALFILLGSVDSSKHTVVANNG